MDEYFCTKVSVLVAARNEELNIESCLEALINQDYPNEKFEIWVGDDHSEDKTGEIVNKFLNQHPHVHLLEINRYRKHLKGKANVLAQLMEKVSGEIICITDADTVVPPGWISKMIQNLEDADMVTGVTAIKRESLFASLQNAEWLFYIGNGHILSKKGKSVSAIGNNMAMRKKAYDAVGGYEHIPFSITEDYELFKHIMMAGGRFKTLFEPNVLAITKPITNFYKYLHQRKRWLHGAFQLPWPFILGLIFLWTLLPFSILVGILWGWKYVIAIFLIKWGIDLYFMRRLYKMIEQKPDLGYWLYTPYSFICNTIILIFYLVPSPVNWKGREYR